MLRLPGFSAGMFANPRSDGKAALVINPAHGEPVEPPLHRILRQAQDERFRVPVSRRENTYPLTLLIPRLLAITIHLILTGKAVL